MLKRLKLNRFRHVRPGTELVFTERFNVLLGRNGTGKTTLLDLISMVLRSDFTALRDEDFDIEYEISAYGGLGIVRVENKSRPLSPANHAISWGKQLRYSLHVWAELRRPPDKIEIEVEGSTVRVRPDGGEWQSRDLGVDAYQTPWIEVLSGSALEPITGVAYRFDESLEVFTSITSRYDGQMLKPTQTPPLILSKRVDGLRTVRVFFPEKYEVPLPEPGQSSVKVELPAGSSLAKFPALAGMSSLSLSLSVVGSREEPDGLTWNYGYAELLFGGPRGVVFNHNALSYGQKRLLAFLYYLDVNPRYVIADELVNGMHRDWIRACIDEIGDRQAFLTSQNPLLLDYLPLESAEQAQKTFIQCRSEPPDSPTSIVWSNLSADDAAELVADYKVGIQPVGEILHARGLW